MVRPKKVGPVNIKVTARSSRAGDGVERILHVEPEGVPQYENMALLIDLRDRTQFDGNFTFEIPKNAVPDSTKIEISAVGMYLYPHNFFDKIHSFLITFRTLYAFKELHLSIHNS